MVPDGRVTQVEQSHPAQTRPASGGLADQAGHVANGESLEGQVADLGGDRYVLGKKTVVGFSDHASGKTVGQLWAG